MTSDIVLLIGLIPGFVMIAAFTAFIIVFLIELALLSGKEK